MHDATPATSRILVWDLPVRLFHWMLAISFAGAWITADSERWRDIHILLGYTAGVLVVLRLAWGLVGTRHARFASFVRGPRRVIAYLRSLVSGRPEHATGHNPAAASLTAARFAPPRSARVTASAAAAARSRASASPSRAPSAAASAPAPSTIATPSPCSSARTASRWCSVWTPTTTAHPHAAGSSGLCPP